MTDDLRSLARAWAERSSLEQNLPLRVSDARTLDDVSLLLRGGSGRYSDPPDRPEAVRVEAVVAATSGIDDYVVEHGGDDGSLSGEGKIRPQVAKLGGVTDVLSDGGGTGSLG